MKKIILFKNGIETLGYFSIQLAKEFKTLRYEVFMFDLLEEKESFTQLKKFCQEGSICAVMFNFTGLRNETCFYPEGKENFWDSYQIHCINIVVDHPFYYHELLEHRPKLYTQMCIDSYHQTYMSRFFPDIEQIPWMPLAGTKLENRPWKERKYDIVFTGNYTPPKKFEQHITRINEEYTEFYYEIIEDLIHNPEKPMEEVFEDHIKEQMPDLSEGDLRECMGSMIFIDLYVRFYYRGLVVKTLVDAGLKVHCFGAGWEELECDHVENLICGGSLTSKECLEVISNSKLSLNVMPWFKDGAHDRIFNSMLNGAVSVTDDSRYLRDQFEDGRELIFYTLHEIDQLPKRLSNLFKQEDLMMDIARCGYEKALAAHTWKNRAEYLLKYMK